MTGHQAAVVWPSTQSSRAKSHPTKRRSPDTWVSRELERKICVSVAADKRYSVRAPSEERKAKHLESVLNGETLRTTIVHVSQNKIGPRPMHNRVSRFDYFLRTIQ